MFNLTYFTFDDNLFDVMKLQQLRYILEIARSGSINEAAKNLYITQPSLSTAVKELEAEFGIEIFVRTSKGVSLSTDGVEFLGYAKQVLDQLLTFRIFIVEMFYKMCYEFSLLLYSSVSSS